MSHICLIVGPLRSGTSLVASMVHRLGWCAVSTMGPPIPPSWRADWEDLELSVPLIRGVRPTPEWLAAYIERRRAVSRLCGMGGKVALKSPYLAFIWPTLLEAIEYEPVVVRTYRDEVSMEASRAAHDHLLSADLQRRIRLACREIRPTLEIGYGPAIDYPTRTASALAQALGVTDAVAVAAAAAIVGLPTRYTPCPSSQQPSQAEPA